MPMRRHLPLALTLLGLAAFAGVLAWVLVAADAFEGLGPIWGWVVGGVVVTGLLTAVLMWLAFFSARRGYDDIDREP